MTGTVHSHGNDEDERAPGAGESAHAGTARSGAAHLGTAHAEQARTELGRAELGRTELGRAELAGRELAARTVLVLGLCAGTGLVASGTYDHLHAGRPDGVAAKLSLIIGAAVVLAACALLVLLGLRDRDRRRLMAAYGGPGGSGSRAPHGLRAAWVSLSCLALLLAFIFLASGLVEAFKSDPYEEPDPTIYGVLLLWAAVLTAAGCAGIHRTRRDRPRTGGTPRGVPLGKNGHGPAPVAPAPTNPRAALFSALGSEPAAPHRLSPRLTARLRTVSRTGAVTLATLGALLGCALTGVAALAPRELGGGNGLFWTLAALTALYLLALLLELAHYGPRRRYLVLVVLTGLALVGIAWNGYDTTTLLERGRWITTEVTEVHHQSKGGPRCDLRAPRGAPGSAGLSIGCRDAEPGDRMPVFYDPEGDAVPRHTQPRGLTGFHTAWGTASAVLVTTAVLSALYGHRRRCELGLLGEDGRPTVNTARRKRT